MSRKGVAYSMSVSVGDLAYQHDTDPAYRKHLKNVDPSRTARNQVLVAESLEDFYARRFGAEVEEYNRTQRERGHPERCISDYLVKVRSEWAREREALLTGRKSKRQKTPPAFEYVVQVGNRDSHPGEDACAEIYVAWLARMRERCPGMEVVWAAVHVDETGGTPHLHVAMVPIGESRRGLPEQVGMNRCLRRCGLRTKADLMQTMQDCLEDVCRDRGIERLDMGQGGREHVDVREWTAGAADAVREAEEAAERAKSARTDADKAEDDRRAAIAQKRDAESARDAAIKERDRQRKIAKRLGPDGQGVVWLHPDGTRTHEASVAEVRTQRDAVQAELEEKREELKRAKSNLTSTYDEGKRVAKKVEEAKAELEKSKSEAASARRAAKEADEARSRAEAARDAALASRTAAEAARDKAIRERDAAVTARDKAKGEAVEAEGQLAGLRAQVAQARAELKRLKENIAKVIDRAKAIYQDWWLGLKFEPPIEDMAREAAGAITAALRDYGYVDDTSHDDR